MQTSNLFKYWFEKRSADGSLGGSSPHVTIFNNNPSGKVSEGEFGIRPESKGIRGNTVYKFPEVSSLFDNSYYERKEEKTNDQFDKRLTGIKKSIFENNMAINKPKKII